MSWLLLPELLAAWNSWAHSHGWSELRLSWSGTQLGIPIGVNLDMTDVFTAVHGSMLRSLQPWKFLPVGPGLKAFVCNLFVLSKPAFLFQFYIPPRKFVGHIQQKLLSYVYGLPLLRCQEAELLSDMGITRTLRRVDTIANLSISRAQVYADLGDMWNGDQYANPEAYNNPPRCVPDHSALSNVRFKRTSGSCIEDYRDGQVALAIEEAAIRDYKKARENDTPVAAIQLSVRKKFQKTLFGYLRPALFGDIKYWEKLLLRLGGDTLALRCALERDADLWRRLDLLDSHLVSVLRVLMNGMFADARFQHDDGSECFLCGEGPNRVEHYIQCPRITMALHMLKLVDARSCYEDGWLWAWADGSMGAHYRVLWKVQVGRGRKKRFELCKAYQRRSASIFPVICHALRESHNQHRHHDADWLSDLEFAETLHSIFRLADIDLQWHTAATCRAPLLSAPSAVYDS